MAGVVRLDGLVEDHRESNFLVVAIHHELHGGRLALEPERRPTAAALLEQPWFDPTAEDEDGEEAVVYRSMSDAGQQVEELEGADALPPPPLPSRQAAFKGEHWE